MRGAREVCGGVCEGYKGGVCGGVCEGCSGLIRTNVEVPVKIIVCTSSL